MKFSQYLITYIDRQVSLYPICTRVLAFSAGDASDILKQDLGFIDIVSVESVDS